jgi:hypothetical protein
MQLVLYLVFGMIDVFAIFALMFKAFRFPYFEYKKEISILAVIISIISYLLRVYFEINQLVDIIVHTILYILFMWLIIKVKVWRSLVISLMYFVYGALSLGTYFFYVSTNILPISVINEPNSYAAYLIQITTQSIAFLISYVLYRTGIGFPFYMRPPHDFVSKVTIKKREMIILTLVLLLCSIGFFTFFYATNKGSLNSIPVYFIAVIVVIYLAYRRDTKK